MRLSIFKKIWLPIMIILLTINFIPILIIGNQIWLNIIIFIIMCGMIIIQLLDMKFKFKILN